VCNGSTCGNRRLVRLNARVLILGHLTLLWLTPERVFGKWLRIGIPIEQYARAWNLLLILPLKYRGRGRYSRQQAKPFFKNFPPRVGPAHMHLSQKTTSHGWVPPTSSSLFSWVGPAHTLFSVIYTTIPSRRPSVKDIIGSVKKFISFYFDRGSCIMSCNVLYVTCCDGWSIGK
jgi:hypothetical protein